MRLLLDTHAVIWWTDDPDRLVPAARHAIAEADVAAVSAATIWEITTKAAIGKLEVPVDDLVDEIRAWGLDLLSVTAEHAWHGRLLPLHHRDPFDRMLVAQAQIEGMTVVTRDPDIARYQIAVLPA
jgi:PIN domain nuclease of toxin-antitoxin system